MCNDQGLETIVVCRLNDVLGGNGTTGTPGRKGGTGSEVSTKVSTKVSSQVSTKATNKDDGNLLQKALKWVGDNGADIADSFIGGEFSTFVGVPDMMDKLMPHPQQA